MSIEIRLTGDAAETLSGPAGELLTELYGQPPERVSQTTGSAATRGMNAGTVDIINMVLTVPSAVLGTVLLIDRLKGSRSLVNFLEKAKQTGGSAVLCVGGRVLDLMRATANEVIDFINKHRNG